MVVSISPLAFSAGIEPADAAPAELVNGTNSASLPATIAKKRCTAI
jgi:hypothetical protein